MTCASCANRIERKLNKLEGVEASVNFATEQAAVRFDRTRSTSTTWSLRSKRPATTRSSRRTARRGSRSPRGAIRRRLVVAVALTVPLVVVAMVAPLQFPGWEWLALALSDAGRLLVRLRLPPCRAAVNARHGDGDDGHAHLDRDARCLGLVRRRAPRSSTTRTRLLRGRGGDHDADPARAATSRRERGAARARRFAGSSSSARRRRACCETASRSRSDRGPRRRRRLRRPPGREDPDRRRSSWRASRPSTSRC